MIRFRTGRPDAPAQAHEPARASGQRPTYGTYRIQLDLEIVIIILLILLNGIFAMSEIALISARRSNLELRARQGNAGAQRALRIIEDPDKFLSTIQIGITLIGILTGIYSGDALAAKFGRELALLGIPLRTATIAAQADDRRHRHLPDAHLRRTRSQAYRHDRGGEESPDAGRAADVRALPRGGRAVRLAAVAQHRTAITRHARASTRAGESKVTEEEIRAIIQERRRRRRSAAWSSRSWSDGSSSLGDRSGRTR